MIDNPHTGQKVRIAKEYRDDWLVRDVQNLTGEIAGIGNVAVVRFPKKTVHIPVHYLEPADETPEPNH